MFNEAFLDQEYGMTHSSYAYTTANLSRPVLFELFQMGSIKRKNGWHTEVLDQLYHYF